MVQLSNNKVLSRERFLRILELVRCRFLVSSRKSDRRNFIPRPNDHRSNNIQGSSSTFLPPRHTKCVCVPSPNLLSSYSSGHLPSHFRSHRPQRIRTLLSSLHLSGPCLHLSQCRWILRQRRSRDLCADVDFLPVGEVCEFCILYVGKLIVCMWYCSIFLLYGSCLGRICIHHQYYTYLCSHAHSPWKVFV